MQNRSSVFRFVVAGFVALCATPMVVSQAQAFDDASCARIVPTAQTTTVGLRANETIESARARALDIVSKAAVFEVSGKMLEASRASEERDENGQVSDRFQDATRQSYQGLVRVKQISESLTGFDAHQQLEVTADVSVCVPKTDSELTAERERAEAELTASRERAARDRQPPRIVDPEKVSWFDPVSGEAQLWYWAGPNQTYTFFDKDGFDPATGDPLKRVDRQFSKDWRAIVVKKRIDASNLAIAQQKQEARREAEEAAARQLATQRAEQTSHASDLCDSNAANPNDPRKPGSVAGVSWDALKTTAALAVQSCESAVQNAPAEPRYRYQLARAYSVNDPKRALPLFRQLCREQYPAAFDNYGWALLDRRVGLDDLTGATRAFEAGIRAGDSDAMTSLAGLMVKGDIDLNFPGEPLQLFRRAASLGNQDATAAVARLEAEQAQENALRVQQQEQDRRQAAQQEEAGRMFMGILGGAMANVGRR